MVEYVGRPSATDCLAGGGAAAEDAEAQVGKKNAELREAQARTESILASVADTHIIFDRQWRYIYVNQAAANAIGRPREEILGRTLWELFPDIVDTELDRQYHRAMDERQSVVFDFHYPARKTWWTNRFFPAPEGVAVFATDITERKRVEAALERAHDELERRVIERTAELIKEIAERKRAEAELLGLQDEVAAELTAMTRLHEFSTRLMATTDLQPLLEEVLDATIGLLNADFGNVRLYYPETGGLKIVAQRGFHKEFLDYFDSVYEGTASCGAAMQRRERVIVEDVLADPVFEPHLKIVAAAGYRAVQSTPLFSRNGELLGMISTHFRNTHRPSERELRFVDLYARQAAEMIERKQAEEELRDANTRIAEILESITDGFTAWDQNWRYTYVNERSAELLGKPRDQLIGQSVWDLFPEAVGTETYRKCQQAMAERVPLYFQALFSDRWYENYLYPTKDGLSVSWRDITERKRGEEALRRSEAFLAEGQRISHTGSWAVMFPSGEVLWSAEMYRIYGLDPATAELSQQMAFQLIHPEDRPSVQEAFERALRDKSDYAVEHRAVMADGSTKHLHALGHPMFNESGGLIEYVGTVMDVTERKQAEESLRKTHERVDMILESITDRFFAFDSEWRYTHFNKHAEEQLKVLGKNPASLLGKTLWDEFPNPEPEAAIRRAMSERIAVTDEHYYAPLGEWVENRIYPSPDGGLAMFVTYVTERKRAEEALQKLQAELAHVTRVTTMGELTASIAHEINQPLAAVVTNGNACLRWLAGAKPNLDEAREAVQRIIRDGTRAGDIIQRIRTLVSKTIPEKEALDLNETIQDVAALLQGELRRNAVSLKMELSAALPPALGDRVQLQQVTLNLMMNAIEAMNAVAGRPRELVIQTKNDASDHLRVTMRDSGPGLENLQRIFEPFYTTKWRGMGMGLSISRSIIEAHGGRLWATPNDGPGAAFHFTLPVAGS
jgi:PAS domain S-box-containing protein